MATAVSHDLEFDVARIDDELFQIHLIISKRFLGFMTGAVEGRLQAGLIMRRTHPSTAAASSRLDHHRITKLFGDFHRVFLGLNDSIAAWCDRYAGFACRRASSVLIAHCLHRMGGRADELDVAALADFYEVWVLSEETVAGMNRIDVADLGCAHDPIDSQITFQARSRADADRFIGQLNM